MVENILTTQEKISLLKENISVNKQTEKAFQDVIRGMESDTLMWGMATLQSIKGRMKRAIDETRGVRKKEALEKIFENIVTVLETKQVQSHRDFSVGETVYFAGRQEPFLISEFPKEGFVSIHFY